MLATLLIADSAMAGFGAKRPDATSKSSSSSKNGSVTKTTSAVKQSGQTVGAAKVIECKADQDSEKFFPQSMLKLLMRDKDADFNIKLQKGNKITMSIPPIFNGCGTFTPVLKQNLDSGSVTILMKLVGEKNQELTYGEFLTCIKAKGLIDEEGDFDHKKVTGPDYVESAYEMEYDFDKKADATKTMTVSFGYPRAFSDPKVGFQPAYGFDEKAGAVGDAPCVSAEKISDEIVYINKGRDVLIEEINTACANQDVAKIAELRRSLGNADALRDIAEKLRGEMDVGYLNAARNKDVKEIEAQIVELEKEIDKGLDKMSESKAREKLAEYAKLFERLDEVYINPAISRIDNLLVARAKMKDESPAAKAADEEIKKLNNELSQLNKRRSGASLGNVYKLARKHGAIEQLRSIEGVRLKAVTFAKVNNSDEKGTLTIEGANKHHAQEMAKYEKTLTDINDRYLVSKGDSSPIERAKKEYTIVESRMNKRMSDFVATDNKNEQSYCAYGMLGSMKNPVKCNQWRSGKQARLQSELKRREKDLKYMNGISEKGNAMSQSYMNWQRTVASEESVMADNYDSSVSPSELFSFDQDFSNGVYSQNNGYNPFMYNMGQQQQMYMPQQMMGQPQMMMQQPQMMQQPMMGAWPSFQ